MKAKNCLAACSEQRNELENFICAEFVEHDIVFLSELISKMSIDIECPFCTSLLERLMAIRRDLIKELSQMRNAECGMRKVKRKNFNSAIRNPNSTLEKDGGTC